MGGVVLFFAHLDDRAEGASLGACGQQCAGHIKTSLRGVISTVRGGEPPHRFWCLYCSGCGGLISVPDYCIRHGDRDCPDIALEYTLPVAVIAKRVQLLRGKPLDDNTWESLLLAVELEADACGSVDVDRVLRRLGWPDDL